ncbi:MAG: hypothetical protein JXA95_13415 [Spirochaetales bacterium]|nr:hypothetical protein [Spirochaetales bacterium]
MGKGSLALDSTGSRLAIFCDNDEIEPADTEGIDDMAIGASSVTYQGVWDDSAGVPVRESEKTYYFLRNSAASSGGGSTSGRGCS